jgi:transposase
MSTKREMDTNAKRERRNKLWPEALKREIVAAASAPGASVSIVARRYNVNANMVFGWRKRFSREDDQRKPAQFLPVVVTPERPVSLPVAVPESDMIEIEDPHGFRVRVRSNVKASCLRLVLEALGRR